jgi:ectoine hydroxylase-related dioxygenase (phytanoyl-CoA dioxygenase family)
MCALYVLASAERVFKLPANCLIDSLISVEEIPGMEALFLTPRQIAQFHDHGFLAVPQISTPHEAQWMRDICGRLFEHGIGWHKGDLFDFSGTDNAAGSATSPQMLSLSDYAPELKNTMFRQNALAMARQLLGPSAELVYEHAMLKPARTGSPTPWHQDEAFFPRFTNYRSVTFWMPLQAVDSTNGCLDFIPGSHRGPLLAHRRINDDPRIHGLQAEDADAGQGVACHLAAGEASVHHQRMLHHAGPNLSDAPRFAYALGFGVRSRKLTLRKDFPWNRGAATARHQRAIQAQGSITRVIRQVKSAVKAALYSLLDLRIKKRS